MSALEFLELLAERQLLADRAIAKLRQQIEQSPKRVSARAVAKLLVKKGQLTSEQARRLLETPTAPPRVVPPPLPAEDEELGLAPDRDQPLGLKPDKDEILELDEDLVEPLETGVVVEPLPELDDDVPRAVSVGGAPHDDWDHHGLGTHDDALDHLSDAAVGSSAEGTTLAARRRGLGGLLAGLRRTKGPRKISANRWDSPLMLVGSGALLVMIAAGLALYFFLTRGTGDDAFNAAYENYRQQAYGQAISQFQQFVHDFPDHPQVSAAKVRIGMAQIWGHVERKRWQDALDAVKADLPPLLNEEAFGEARPELASLLPEIMEGFADQALAASDVPQCEAYLARANETFEQVNNSAYLPTSQRTGQQPRIEQIEAKLESVKRRINRDRELEKTVAEIRERLPERQIEQAYALRKELLKAYPSLENDPRLDAVVLEVAQTERDAVQPLANPPAPVTDEPPTAAQFRVALADRRGKRVEALAGQVVFVAAQGAVYGLRGDDGTVLWRHFVGFADQRPPLDLSPTGTNDVVIVHTARRELMRLEGQSGKLVWRLACPGQPSEPRLQGGRLWLACAEGEHGHVLAIDPITGQVQGGATLPLPVSVSPVFDADNGLLIQPAEHSSVYVLDVQDWRCLGVTYLGHAADTIRVPPLILGGAILLAENPGIDFSLLHVLGHDTDQPGTLRPLAEPLRLDGQVIVAPQPFGRRLLVATDRGRVQALELDVNQASSPLRPVADVVADVPAGSASYFLLDEGRLWVADAQLTRYELQTSRGQLVRKWLNQKGDRFLAPLQLRGSTLLTVRQRRGKLGSTVAAVHVGADQAGMREGEAVWEVDLGVPPAGEPFVNRTAQEINVVTGNGTWFAVGRDAIRTGLAQTARQAVLDPQLPPLVAAVEIDETLWAYCSAAGGERYVILDTSGSSPSLRSLTFDLAGQRPVAVPVALQKRLLVPTIAGSIYLVDPATGKPVMAPFQPPMTSGTEVLWQRPTRIDAGDRVLASDGRESLYELAIAAEPQPHLAAVAQHQLDAPPLAPPVALETAILCVVRGSQQDVLRRYDRQSFRLLDQTDLPGHVLWGPQIVGPVALLMTDTMQLIALSATEQVFASNALTTAVVGTAVEYQDGIALATVDGAVWHLRADTGEVLGKVDVDEALGTGPVLFGGNRFIVCGGDGTLHVVALTTQ